MISSITRFIKNRQTMPVITVFCVCVILIALPQSVKVTIVSFFIDGIYYPLNRLDIFLTDIASARDRNVELNRKLMDFSIKSAQYIEDHNENIRLRRMLGFDIQLPFTLTPAEVIGIQPTLLSRSVIINAGYDEGITNMQPVITADGVVGKIIEVGASTSVVQLLIDYNCRISVVDQYTRAMGIVRWNGGKLLEMGDVPQESEVAVGDTIVCSGIGGIFPPSLVVGTVIFAQDSPGSLFKDIKVKPTVNFNSLEEVFVVTYDR